jgi:hypothetical protein
MSIHITHHTYNIALTKKTFENIFYLRISPVQPLAATTLMASATLPSRNLLADHWWRSALGLANSKEGE